MYLSDGASNLRSLISIFFPKSPVSGERIGFGFSAPVLNEPRAYCLRPAFQTTQNPWFPVYALLPIAAPKFEIYSSHASNFAPVELHRRDGCASRFRFTSAKGSVREARLAGSFLAGDESHATQISQGIGQRSEAGRIFSRRR